MFLLVLGPMAVAHNRTNTSFFQIFVANLENISLNDVSEGVHVCCTLNNEKRQ